MWHWRKQCWSPIQQANQVAIKVRTIKETTFVIGWLEWHGKLCSKKWQIPKVRNVALTVVIPQMKTDGCRVTVIIERSRYSSIVSLISLQLFSWSWMYTFLYCLYFKGMTHLHSVSCIWSYHSHSHLIKMGHALLDEKDATIIVVQSNQETIFFNSKFFSPLSFSHSTTLEICNNGILLTAAKIFSLYSVTKCNGNQCYIFVCTYMTEKYFSCQIFLNLTVFSVFVRICGHW